MKKICIVAGDPNSINSELIFKSWNKLSKKTRNKIVLIGSYELLKKQKEKIKIPIRLDKIDKITKITKFNTKLKIIDYPLKFNNCFKIDKTHASKYVSGCLNLAHELCIKNQIKGFINCPIDKNLIKQKGVYGVTEFLGKKNISNKFSEVMFLHNKDLSVVPLTTHVKIKDISKYIKKKIIIKKINTMSLFYKKLFKKKPRIAVLGLNPHNCELEKNSEEVKIIIPAIKELKKNHKIVGPLVADNFFKSSYKDFDVVVGMYHDQVLIPFKNFFKFDAINITLGLNYLRVSPDHGTARDIIGKNRANPKSLLECVKFFNNLK